MVSNSIGSTTPSTRALLLGPKHVQECLVVSCPGSHPTSARQRSRELLTWLPCTGLADVTCPCALTQGFRWLTCVRNRCRRLSQTRSVVNDLRNGTPTAGFSGDVLAHLRRGVAVGDWDVLLSWPSVALPLESRKSRDCRCLPTVSRRRAAKETNFPPHVSQDGRIAHRRKNPRSLTSCVACPSR